MLKKTLMERIFDWRCRALKDFEEIKRFEVQDTALDCYRNKSVKDL